jgi:V/A-type H+-transporting ATPase subunit F
MYLLSDNVDTLRGMRLAGVDGEVVHAPEEFSEAFRRVSADKELGVLLITQKLAAFESVYLESKISHRTPLVVTIPDRHGFGANAPSIADYVQKAIGIKI